MKDIKINIRFRINLHFIKDFFNKRSKLIGQRVLIVRGCYKGETGTVKYCNTCCHDFRIEFDNIGNNTLYSELKDKLIFIK